MSSPNAKHAFESCDNCKGCGGFKERSELKSGRCDDCIALERLHKDRVMTAADNRALARAGRTLLESMASAKKGEPMLPETISAAIDRVGGRAAFGVIIAEEMLKARGDKSVMTPLDAAKWKYSPQAVFKWAELMARMENLHDERETFDAESLSQDELVDGLRQLSMDMVQTSSDYRKFMMELCIKEEPALAHYAMKLAGMGDAVDGKAIGIESDIQDELDDVSDSDPDDDLDYDEAGQ